jgi:hypothetical protein
MWTDQAQETYTIKIKKGVKGSTTKVEKSETGTESIKITDNSGTALNETTKKQDKTWVYEETILEQAGPKKKPTMLKRTYEKATVKSGDEISVLPYQGRTILIEKKNGKFQFHYENGALVRGEDAEHLDKEFNKDNSKFDFQALLLPPKAVAVNETWKIPIAEMMKAWEKDGKLTVDPDKTSASGKLLKAYKKDGRQFGDMVFTLELAVKTIQAENGEMTCEPGTIMNLEFKVSACIDGSTDESVSQSNMRFKGLVLYPSADNPEARVTFTIQGASEQTVKEGSGGR